MKKTLALFCITAHTILSVIFTSPLFAFDWPQQEIVSESLFSYFGQLRGDTISTSIIFRNSATIHPTDAGKIVGIITEHDDDLGWYNSTLGNAVIIAHKDNIISVYANLDEESLSPNLTQLQSVTTDTELGTSGSSGWMQGESCLEFQILDIHQQTAINPRILMPRTNKELDIHIGNLSAVSKKGVEYDFRVTQTLPAGQYYIYRTRQETVTPYQTTVSINGTVVETIKYDLLKQENQRVAVIGNKSYPLEKVYPNDKKHLIADLTLTRGRNVLSVIATDLMGQNHTVSYTLNVQ
ncbi:MAG: M23 family metallopeptidase [Treponema sp.]|nr:M23 family metallopeptidase [Treponema sp.]